MLINGLFPRAFPVSQNQKEILAYAYHHHSAVAECADCLRPGQCHCAVYLYHILKKIASVGSLKKDLIKALYVQKKQEDTIQTAIQLDGALREDWI